MIRFHARRGSNLRLPIEFRDRLEFKRTFDRADFRRLAYRLNPAIQGGFTFLVHDRDCFKRGRTGR